MKINPPFTRALSIVTLMLAGLVITNPAQAKYYGYPGEEDILLRYNYTCSVVMKSNGSTMHLQGFVQGLSEEDAAARVVYFHSYVQSAICTKV